jgi:hypothetical protein
MKLVDGYGVPSGQFAGSFAALGNMARQKGVMGRIDPTAAMAYMAAFADTFVEQHNGQLPFGRHGFGHIMNEQIKGSSALAGFGDLSAFAGNDARLALHSFNGASGHSFYDHYTNARKGFRRFDWTNPLSVASQLAKPAPTRHMAGRGFGAFGAPWHLNVDLAKMPNGYSPSKDDCTNWPVTDNEKRARLDMINQVYNSVIGPTPAEALHHWATSRWCKRGEFEREIRQWEDARKRGEPTGSSHTSESSLTSTLNWLGERAPWPLDQMFKDGAAILGCINNPSLTTAGKFGCFFKVLWDSFISIITSDEFMILLAIISGNVISAVMLIAKKVVQTVIGLMERDDFRKTIGLSPEGAQVAVAVGNVVIDSGDLIGMIIHDGAKTFSQERGWKLIGGVLSGKTEQDRHGVIRIVGDVITYNADVIALAVEKGNPLHGRVKELLYQKYVEPFEAIAYAVQDTSTLAQDQLRKRILADGTELAERRKGFQLISQSLIGLGALFNGMADSLKQVPLISALGEYVGKAGSAITQAGVFVCEFATIFSGIADLFKDGKSEVEQHVLIELRKRLGALGTILKTEGVTVTPLPDMSCTAASLSYTSTTTVPPTTTAPVAETKIRERMARVDAATKMVASTQAKKDAEAARQARETQAKKDPPKKDPPRRDVPATKKQSSSVLFVGGAAALLGVVLLKRAK